LKRSGILAGECRASITFVLNEEEDQRQQRKPAAASRSTKSGLKCVTAFYRLPCVESLEVGEEGFGGCIAVARIGLAGFVDDGGEFEELLAVALGAGGEVGGWYGEVAVGVLPVAIA